MKATTLEDWKGFRPVAFVARSPDELAKRTGLQFSVSNDDLDILEEEAFFGSRGTVFGLVSHVGAPVPGTEVLAHESDIAKGVPKLIEEALEGLRLSAEHVRWILEADEAVGPEEGSAAKGRSKVAER